MDAHSCVNSCILWHGIARIYLYLLECNFYSWKMAGCQRNIGKTTRIVCILHHSISGSGTQRPVVSM